MTDILSFPNTKWCGRGNRASSYGQLGAFDTADSCCRQHDSHCPFFIQSFERKYGYFNMALGTLSHCSCDLRSVLMYLINLLFTQLCSQSFLYFSFLFLCVFSGFSFKIESILKYITYHTPCSIFSLIQKRNLSHR